MKKYFIFLTLSLLFAFSGCKKPYLKENDKNTQKISSKLDSYEKIVIPNSLKNIRNAQASNPDNQALAALDLGDVSKQKYYIRIDYGNMDSSTTSLLVNDSAFYVFSFPIDNKGLYVPDDRLGQEEVIDEFKDGFGYASIPATKPVLRTLNFEVLDTLIDPAAFSISVGDLLEEEANKINQLPTDEEIDQNSGNKQKLLARKYPTGYVKYGNTELGSKPLRGVTVFALHLGNDVTHVTDANGHFHISTGFRVTGTFVGIHFRSNRYKIRPADARGTIVGSAIGYISDWISGANYRHGWVHRADLESININLNNDNAPNSRYWAHIVDGLNYHDQFTAQEQIASSPSFMHIAALRVNESKLDTTRNGAGNTLMLPHMNLAGMMNSNLYSGLPSYIGFFLDFATSIPIAIIKSTMPDQKYKVGDNLSQPKFSCRFMKVVLHELSHAAKFTKMGTSFYMNLGLAQYNTGTTYGAGPPYTETVNSSGQTISYVQNDFAYSQVEEAWCEFLAQNFASRIYNGATAGSASREWMDGYLGAAPDPSIKPFNLLKENEHYFVSKWIPKGAFNDFMDAADPVNEPWDNISGFTIKQLWDVFNPQIISDYHYRQKMALMYPWVSEANVKAIFTGNKF